MSFFVKGAGGERSLHIPHLRLCRLMPLLCGRPEQIDTSFMILLSVTKGMVSYPNEPSLFQP